MRRIIAIFKRDLYSSIRDYMLLYMIVAPILLAVGLMFFIPSAQSASIQFAVHESIGSEVINTFKNYGSVEVYNSLDDLKKRVKNIDDIAGIIKTETGELQLVLEGNENHDTKEVPKKIIRSILLGDKLNIKYVVKDIGIKTPPVALIGSISIVLMAILIGGVVIGLNIIEEKELNTIKAMNVSPMKRMEFIIGKSIIGVVLPIFQVYLILRILGFSEINFTMTLIMTLASSLLAIVVGFIIGVMSSNQMAGIANLKIVFIALSIAIIGAILLPESKHFLLYWAPPYWSFMGFKKILLDTITWQQLGMYVSWILILTLLVFILFKNRIKKGLN